MRGAVKRILDIEYENYYTFGKPSDDDGTLRAELQPEHDAEVEEVCDIVEAEAKTWKLNSNITQDELERLRLINQLLLKATDGDSVLTSKLEKALTPYEFDEYNNSLQQPIKMAEVLYADGMPEELKHYNILLREADFQLNKYEKMNSLKSSRRYKYKHDTLSKTYNKSEALYERALENLQEVFQIAKDRNRLDVIERWMDRDVVFASPEQAPTPEADGVPRVKGSRSHYAQDAALPKLSVRLKRQQRILEALLNSAETIAFEPEVVVADNTKPSLVASELRHRLAKIKSATDTLNPEKD